MARRFHPVDQVCDRAFLGHEPKNTWAPAPMPAAEPEPEPAPLPAPRVPRKPALLPAPKPMPESESGE